MSIISEMSITDPDLLVFGVAPKPLQCGLGLTLGAGQVFPEVNFTLPPLTIGADTWPEVLAHYNDMIEHVLKRAIALHAPGIVIEFELLPAMTERPEWGAEITALLKKHLREAHQKSELPCALRVTPTDVRERERPPLLRTGQAWERLRESLDLCAAAGADILSIESVGGKEVHDRALVEGDLRGIVAALGILAPRDMAWLWEQIVAICAKHPGVIAGGDSACGFANTAMQLAGQHMLPEVMAAVIRAMSAPRSLVAYECGAQGPSKDCAYEGPVMKAIAGVPISMEGKSAACAHFSPLGNIAAAMCDLWSNESVQNVRLLSGNAPEALTEMLEYDCRLMNAASASGKANVLRDLMTQSDERLSPQAIVLSPQSTIAIAKVIVGEETPYRRTVGAGRAALTILSEEAQSGRLQLKKKEIAWLQRLKAGLEELPDSEAILLNAIDSEYGCLLRQEAYGLSPR
jgi:methanol--5-hydroxybenzimidazolylcobamide Co-methyltransferase